MCHIYVYIKVSQNISVAVNTVDTQDNVDIIDKVKNVNDVFMVRSVYTFLLCFTLSITVKAI